MKSVEDYFAKGGRVCPHCDPLFQELGKCRKHSNVHKITHMGLWRWLRVGIWYGLVRFWRWIISVVS